MAAVANSKLSQNALSWLEQQFQRELTPKERKWLRLADELLSQAGFIVTLKIPVGGVHCESTL
jgi:hypothetical protein